MEDTSDWHPQPVQGKPGEGHVEVHLDYSTGLGNWLRLDVDLAPGYSYVPFDRVEDVEELIEDLESMMARILASANHGEPIAGGWIWESHLQPFLQALSGQVGYRFDSSDWETVASAIATAEEGDWFAHSLPGTTRLDVRMARDTSANEVALEISGAVTRSVRQRIDLLLQVYGRVPRRADDIE